MKEKKEKGSHSFSAYFKRAVSPLVVLSLLRGRSMYGYEISQEITQKTDGTLSVAVLYPILYRLEEQGYIRITQTTIENGRARNYYTATKEGIAYLKTVYGEYRRLSDSLCTLIDTEAKRKPEKQQ